jgi:hypothetical protein
MSAPNSTSDLSNQRRPSIAERASTMLEGKLTGLETRFGSISRTKSLSTSKDSVSLLEEQYSMDPRDYEILQPIGYFC